MLDEKNRAACQSIVVSCVLLDKHCSRPTGGAKGMRSPVESLAKGNAGSV
jgi:hypothetical protein